MDCILRLQVSKGYCRESSFEDGLAVQLCCSAAFCIDCAG